MYIIYNGKHAYGVTDEKFIPAGSFVFKPEDGQMFIAVESGKLESIVSEAIMVNSDNFAEILNSAEGELVLKLESDIVISEPLTLTPGSIVEINLNNHNISASDGVSYPGGLITIPHGTTLIMDGEGTFDSGSGAMSPFQLTSRDLADDSKEACLIINSGNYIGRDYIVCGNGNPGRGNSELIIQGGEFKASTIVYNPQENSTVIVNDGNLIGEKCGIEMRSGSLIVNGGTIASETAPTEVSPNGNGTTTEGAAIAICQHTTKNPIDVVINNGIFIGYHAFYQANPQNNEQEAIDKINLSIVNGIFNAINGGTMPIYSENKEKFITGGTFSHAIDEKYMA